MTAEHNQLSPFANGPTENDAAEHGADTGIPIPSRFGAPLARILPIPTRQGHPLPSTSGAAAGPGGPAAGSAVLAAGSQADAAGPVVAPAAPSDASAQGGEAGAVDESAYADTFYGQIGGHATFEKIIHVFYEGIAADPLLRAMYHEEDLGPAERRMLMFMEQYWGGPRTYLEERGHPRLRMRHVPFAVTPEARDRWLAAMRKGVDAVELSPLHEATLWDYLERAAASLVNSPSEPTQRA